MLLWGGAPDFAPKLIAHLSQLLEPAHYYCFVKVAN